MKHTSSLPRHAISRNLRFEMLEQRQLLAIDTWQNPVQPLDVNGDAHVSPLDALIVINALNEHGPGNLNAIFGSPSQYYYDVNGDDLLSPLDALMIINRLNASQGGPKVQVALTNDTGASATDRITSDPASAGSLTVPAGWETLGKFTARLNSSTFEFDMLHLLQEDGTFEIDLNTLRAINSNVNVPDGSHTLRLTAVNDLGQSSTATLSFTLDRAALAPGVPQVTLNSLSGSLPDATNITTPKFNVTAEPGSTVSLFANGELVAQGAAGTVLSVDTPLADGSYSFQARVTDLAGNVSALSGASSLQIASAAPQFTLEMMPFTADLTPDVRVWAESGALINTGAAFYIDVDLNDDGQFDGVGETNYSTGQLYRQTGVLQQQMPLSKPLPFAGNPYFVNVRARVVDAVGNVATSDVHRMYVSSEISTVLQDYVNNDDGAYEWSLHSEFTVNNPGLLGGAFTVYVIDLRSQRWRTPEDFGEPTSNHPFADDQTLWQHYLTLFVPTQVRNDSALLLISGGSYTQAPLTPADFSDPNSQVALLGQQASLLGSMTVYLPVIPRENVRFADETRTRTEDAIIAYSFDKFLNEPLGSVSDWPVLLAMAKAAVKAMDATQEFVAQYRPDLTVEDFVVTGGSKRGWTTWLTAAADDRVRAIMPMIFDALNLGQQMVHHYGVYDDFSYAIQDYAEMQVFERLLTDRGRELGLIVDPYSYLNNGRFNIPKLIINSAGDEFFVTDSSQYYFHDLPGNDNYLLYIANTGHGLDYDNGANSKTVQALTTFYDAVVNNKPLPKFSWEVRDNGMLRVQTVTAPIQVVLWQGTNPEARDFRNATTDVTWTSSVLSPAGAGIYVANLPAPATGATAYFIELIFPSTLNIQGVPLPFRFTTDVVVSSNDAFHPWPFEVGSIGGTPIADPSESMGFGGAGTIVAYATIIDESDDLSWADADGLSGSAAALPSTFEAAMSSGSPMLTAAAAVPTSTSDTLAATALRPSSFGSYGPAELSDLLFADDIDDLFALWA